ncbi:hypothetical protein RRG08_059317, partial [Elysia crispata]
MWSGPSGFWKEMIVVSSTPGNSDDGLDKCSDLEFIVQSPCAYIVLISDTSQTRAGHCSGQQVPSDLGQVSPGLRRRTTGRRHTEKNRAVMEAAVSKQEETINSDRDSKAATGQILAQDGSKDTASMSSQCDQLMTNLTSESQGVEHSGCEQGSSDSSIETGCDRNEKLERPASYLDTVTGDDTEEVFCAKRGDPKTAEVSAGGLSCVPSPATPISSATATAENPELAGCGDCTSHAHKSNNNNVNGNNSRNNNSNNNKHNYNNDIHVDKNDPFCGNLRRGHPINKILSPLFSPSSSSSSSSSSSPSFFPSSLHRASSSLSSISEAEMLTMMETMGESEILSALPPCDCDECLLNGPNSPTIVPPDQRTLTR